MEWFKVEQVAKYDTWLPTNYHGGAIWARLSGQVYLDDEDFVWAGNMLKELCDRVRNGEAGI